MGPSHTTASKSIWDPLILVLSQYIFFIYLFLFLYVLYMLLLVTSIVSYFCILYRGLKSINFWKMYYLLLEDIFAGKDYILSTWNNWQHWKIKLIKSNFSTYRYKLTYRIYIVIIIHSKMVSRNLKNIIISLNISIIKI